MDIKKTIVQFIKFGMVGVSNTLMSYGIEMLCYYVLLNNVVWKEAVRIFVISGISFAVSTVHSYYWNNRYVFQADGKLTFKKHLIRYFRMAASYALTGLILSPVLKTWLTKMGLAFWLVSILVLCVSVPVNFLLNKLWAFKNRNAVE